MRATVCLLVMAAACAPQPIGPATKAGKAAPAASTIPSTQSAAMPGQCMGLIGSDRDQCLRRFGASGAGSTAPGK
jgi:hypothetical protein